MRERLPGTFKWKLLLSLAKYFNGIHSLNIKQIPLIKKNSNFFKDNPFWGQKYVSGLEQKTERRIRQNIKKNIKIVKCIAYGN